MQAIQNVWWDTSYYYGCLEQPKKTHSATVHDLFFHFSFEVITNRFPVREL